MERPGPGWGKGLKLSGQVVEISYIFRRKKPKIMLEQKIKNQKQRPLL